jgi:hypothetical protein
MISISRADLTQKNIWGAMNQEYDAYVSSCLNRPHSFSKWVRERYQCEYLSNKDVIIFNNEAHLTLFLLRAPS